MSSPGSKSPIPKRTVTRASTSSRRTTPKTVESPIKLTNVQSGGSGAAKNQASKNYVKKNGSKPASAKSSPQSRTPKTRSPQTASPQKSSTDISSKSKGSLKTPLLNANKTANETSTSGSIQSMKAEAYNATDTNLSKNKSTAVIKSSDSMNETKDSNSDEKSKILNKTRSKLNRAGKQPGTPADLPKDRKSSEKIVESEKSVVDEEENHDAEKVAEKSTESPRISKDGKNEDALNCNCQNVCCKKMQIFPCFRGEYPTRNRPGTCVKQFYQRTEGIKNGQCTAVEVCNTQQEVPKDPDVEMPEGVTTVTETHFLSIDSGGASMVGNIEDMHKGSAAVAGLPMDPNVPNDIETNFSQQQSQQKPQAMQSKVGSSGLQGMQGIISTQGMPAIQGMPSQIDGYRNNHCAPPCWNQYQQCDYPKPNIPQQQLQFPNSPTYGMNNPRQPSNLYDQQMFQQQTIPDQPMYTTQMPNSYGQQQLQQQQQPQFSAPTFSVAQPPKTLGPGVSTNVLQPEQLYSPPTQAQSNMPPIKLNHITNATGAPGDTEQGLSYSASSGNNNTNRPIIGPNLHSPTDMSLGGCKQPLAFRPCPPWHCRFPACYRQRFHKMRFMMPRYW